MSVEKGMEQQADEAKLGLALSGGGFRASFFHIGVLAQLARLGLLRHVQVISTVSGGSIIGALYYLHVKRLLETKTDEEIDDRDYILIVKDIERDFLKAVQSNPRMMTYCDWKKNWRMAAPDYSRSDRLGELYDEYFYRPVLDPGLGRMIRMKDLYIHPKIAPGPDGQRHETFNPREDNAGRRAKVPILLINATALNNGHNWRFEASTMGEPRADDEVSMDINKSIRLRRPSSYDAMIKRQQDVELGLAVAASACVPGIFNPLAISDLYPDIRVELVDGGVHDNQGVQALIDLDGCCDLMVVSDGSGQMDDADNPHTWLAAVLNRSQGIFMKRVREEQLRRVLKDRSGRVAFFHLREGIPPRICPWNGQDGMPGGVSDEAPRAECSSFGVSAEAQALLSRIRTDLDSFTEVEAYSLMLDGYLVSNHALSRSEAFKRLARAPRELESEDWEFMKIRPWVEKPTPQYLKHLHVAGSQFFKVFKLNIALGVGVVAVLAVFAWWLVFKSPLSDARIGIDVQGALITVLIAGTAFLLPRLAENFSSLRFLGGLTRKLASYLGQGVLPLLAMLPVRFHLKFIDPLFIRMGRLKNLAPPR